MSEPTAEDREKALEIWQRNNPLRIDTPDDRYEPFVTDIAHALGATREESSARIAELEQDLAGGIRVKVAGKYLYTDERLQSEIAAVREEAEAPLQQQISDLQQALAGNQDCIQQMRAECGKLRDDLRAENARLRGALKADGLYRPTDETDKVPTL